VTATPRPTVTTYVTIASGGRSSGWTPVATFGGLIAALGTLALGIAALRRRSDKSAPQPDKTAKV
jgi:hypothetical protein